MASNNLRILYNNLVDNNTVYTSVEASSAAIPVTNLALDTKGLVWRSTTNTDGVTPTLTTTATQSVSSTVIDPTTGTVVASPTITATAVTSNIIYCTSTTGFVIGYPIIFGSNVGGLLADRVYYIAAINSILGFVVTTASKANLIASFYTNSSVATQSLNTVKLVALPFTNLTTSSIIRVRGYVGTKAYTQAAVSNPTITPGSSTVFDSGFVPGVPYQLSGDWSWGSSGIGVNTFAYGGGTYARVYISTGITACTSISIEIFDNNPNKYIECSRLVVGDYWTPQYNTQYGLSTTVLDNSTNQRTESGDLITNRGIKSNKLNFDMGYLSYTDRDNLLSIMRGAGISKPLFISLFPQDSDSGKERAHQIYGKLSGINAVTHTSLSLYSSSLEIEEI
jgi:hypothetical protein